MMYPYMTLNDDTGITHSEEKPDGRVKVYIETPDARDGFHSAVCWLADYTWQDIRGYSESEMEILPPAGAEQRPPDAGFVQALHEHFAEACFFC